MAPQIFEENLILIPPQEYYWAWREKDLSLLYFSTRVATA